MKQIAKTIYKKIFPTLYVKHCSQTIYQALLATLHMYEATNEKYWLDEAKKLKDIMIDIQQKDGGWDIGYFFNFGYNHSKGESTSPELLSLVALIKYWEIDKDERVKLSIQKGIDWIINNSYELKDDWVIPYGPYSTKDVVVYNGISFAQAPLAMWSKYEENIERKNKIIEIYRGMNRYLAKQLIKTDNGSYMLYSVPCDGMDDKAREKVDYYHMAQQLEMHNYANEYCPDENALKIVLEFGEHLLSIQKEDGAISYFNNDPFIGIHLWGFCSNINAFLDIHKIMKNEKYLNGATKIKDWIMKNAYNYQLKHFSPILDERGNNLNLEYYPRSDAWVINSLSKYFSINQNDDELKKIIKNTYETLVSSNYSGLENHAGSKTKLFIRKNLLKIFKK